MAGEETPDRPSNHLPPRDHLLVDPTTFRMETPLDERGLVVIPDLIEAVKALVDPDYKWPRLCNDHHFYHYARWYPSIDDPEQVNPAAFRDLSVHRGYLPMQFHQLLHEVTLPPPVPDVEVMRQRVRAVMAAKLLFGSIVDNQERRRELGQTRTKLERHARRDPRRRDLRAYEDMDDKITRIQNGLKHFYPVEHYFEQIDGIPKDLLVIDLPQTVKPRVAVDMLRAHVKGHYVQYHRWFNYTGGSDKTTVPYTGQAA